MRPQIVLLLGLLGVCASWGVAPNLGGHGLRALYNAEPPVIDQVVFLTSNDTGFQVDEPASVRWSGYLYQSRAGTVEFAVPGSVRSRLTIGGVTVFDRPAGAARATRAGAQLAAGFNPISFEIETAGAAAGYMQAGLEWAGLRQSLVPAVYLYPDATTAAAAERAVQAARAAAGLGAVGWLLLVLAPALWLWPQRARLRSRTALGLGAIVLLAFSLRLLFLADYAAQPTADVLAAGSDHRGYQGAALDYVRGRWPPPAPFYVQPGMSLAMGWLYAAALPSLRLVQLVQMLVGAGTALLIFEIARRSFSVLTAWIAALLWAVYPLAMFYEAQVTTHGLEAVAGAVLLLLWMVAMQNGAGGWQQIWIVAGLGCTLGVASVLRPTFLILAPFMFASLLAGGAAGWRQRALAALVLVACTCLPIAPVTWHNYRSSGRFQLLTNNSGVTFYLGNNRDSTGLGEYSAAYWATHYFVSGGKVTYAAQAWRELAADPGRWGQLMVRKTALFLGDAELPNNVDFYKEGVAISRVLAWLPLRFGALMALALAGAGLALWRAGETRDLQRNRLILLVYALVQAAVVIAFHVFSRFRAPLYPLLAIAGAYPLASIVSAVLAQRWRTVLAGVAGVLAAGAFVGVMPVVAAHAMDAPVVSALPVTALALNIPLEQGITLAGYEPLAAGAPGEPQRITLYWTTDQRLLTDYFVSVQLFSGATKVAQADQAMGTGSFPDYPASAWQAGEIVRDALYVRSPAGLEAPVALAVVVIVYERASGARLGEANLGLLPITTRQASGLPAGAIESGAHIGSAVLRGYALQEKTLVLYWEAGERAAGDGVVFVHLFGAQGNFVAGADGRPRNGGYSTLAWQAREGIVDAHNLPDVPAGTYMLKIGMYDAVTQVRFAASAADGAVLPDGILPLGSIAIP